MRFVLILVVITALAPPAAATAFLGIETGPNWGPDNVDAVVAPASGEHFLDLLLYPYGDDDYDNINEYDVMVRAPRGVTLVRAERPDNWVFTEPGAHFFVVDGAADHLFINASSPDERVNITGYGRNAARIYYSIDPGTAPGLYPISLEQPPTRTYSAIPGDTMPPLDVTNPGLVLVTPEPSGLAVIAAGGILALRRRRTRLVLE